MIQNILQNQNCTKEISINTVDSFQGQEKDIILFSTVRSSSDGLIGFLSEPRRMNVALTRARECIFIIGNANSLIQNKLWRTLLRDSNERQYYRRTQSSNANIAEKVKNDEWNEEERKMDQQLTENLQKYKSNCEGQMEDYRG